MDHRRTCRFYIELRYMLIIANMESVRIFSSITYKSEVFGICIIGGLCPEMDH